MQNWKDLYKELCTLISEKIPAVKWIDLWHNQVSFLENEHPFPTPAVFLSFRAFKTTDTGEKVQQVRLQLDTYIFYETFADTYKDSWNQDDALGFLDLLNDVYAALHGSSGTNYSEMRRIGFAPVDTGSAGNLYQQIFECVLVDYAAAKNYVDVEINDVQLMKGTKPEEEEGENLFIIPG